MKQAILDLLSSKKGIATIVGVLVVVLSPIVGLFGYEVDTARLAVAVGLIATYVVGQGVADNGKEAAALHLHAAELEADRPMAVVSGQVRS